MSFEIPHKDDLATNSKLPGQLTENFKALEQEDHDDDARLSQEIQDRKDADAQEKSDRIAADNLEAQERQKADADEAEHRKAADAEEAEERQAADTQERSDRIRADDAESITRSNADADLQRQINELNIRLTTAENNIIDLQTRTTSLEEQVKKLNEIIFGTQYINDTDEIPLDNSMTPGNDVEVNDTETVNDDEAEVRTPDHDVLADEVN